MGKTFQGNLVGTGLKIAIAISRFNDTIGLELLRGAQTALRMHGVAESDVDVAWVPGAFELPLVARKLADTRNYDAVICLGVVIRGATTHYELVSAHAAAGIASASQQSGVPVIFGVLTTENIEQAWERAGTKAGNNGAHAAQAAIEMATLLRQLQV